MIRSDLVHYLGQVVRHLGQWSACWTRVDHPVTHPRGRVLRAAAWPFVGPRYGRGVPPRSARRWHAAAVPGLAPARVRADGLQRDLAAARTWPTGWAAQG